MLLNQIEVLKQQLRIYADDFATEREDRERNQAEKEKMREELNAMKEQVQTLEQQVGFSYNYKTCYGFGSIILMCSKYKFLTKGTLQCLNGNQNRM